MSVWGDIMHIHMKELASKGNTLELVEDLDLTSLLKDRNDLLDYSPVHTDLKGHYVSGAVEVDGTLSLQITQPCSRCLTPVKQTLTLPFHERFVQQGTEAAELEDEDVNTVADEKIELTPYVEETVLLGLPFVPLCNEDCKGLCPVCGENRNEQPCSCRQERVDPRLAGLADFFKNS